MGHPLIISPVCVLTMTRMSTPSSVPVRMVRLPCVTALRQAAGSVAMSEIVFMIFVADQDSGKEVFPAAPGHRWPPPVESPSKMCWVRASVARFRSSSASTGASASPTPKAKGAT